jgi:hypothetical protein
MLSALTRIPVPVPILIVAVPEVAPPETPRPAVTAVMSPPASASVLHKSAPFPSVARTWLAVPSPVGRVQILLKMTLSGALKPT